ncbi:MAG: imidazolonepropionase [Anaerolineae bacterium]
MNQVELLIHSANQICVIPPQDGGPQRGDELGDLGLIEDGAVAVDGGLIVAVGPTEQLRAAYSARSAIDASGKVIIPGFVDPHTHLVWAGDRANEFEMRVAGATYIDIMATGGGIVSTVRATRAAGMDQLVAQARPRLDRMLALGSTTVEAKSGYGLDTASELKILDATLQLDAQHPVDLVPTFLGAHAVPPEYKGRTDDYVSLVVEEMLPAVHQWSQDKGVPLPFVDVFCEKGAFDLAQSRRVLERARELSFPLKIHADEFAGLGGTALAVELGATSADHLVCTPQADIEALGRGETIAVGLPCTPFGLGHHEYTPAKAILAAGGALALATDCNPGTAWCESMQFVVALACRAMALTPAQALAAATLNAAFAVGRGEQVGSLTAGKAADILVVNAPDYRHLGYRFGGNLVETVIKGGHIVSKNERP